jgi:hypothetical protein
MEKYRETNLKPEEKEIFKRAGFSDTLIYSLEMQDSHPDYIASLLQEAHIAIKNGELVQTYGLDTFERKKYIQIIENQEIERRKIDIDRANKRNMKKLKIEKIKLLETEIENITKSIDEEYKLHKELSNQHTIIMQRIQFLLDERTILIIKLNELYATV